MTNAPATISVDIISDVMCPWCFIGKRRLERAQAMVADRYRLEMSWRPFQLDASLPAEGLDRRTYLEQKFGGPEQARDIYAQIEAAGAAEGLDFNFDAIAVSPNTLDAHRLIRWAGDDNRTVQGAVVEQLFQRFFFHGEHVGQAEVLSDVADGVGMDAKTVRARLLTDEDRAAVSAEAQRAGEIGVTGVPCFIFGRTIAVMGAHEPESLIEAIRQAAEAERPH